VSPASAGDPVVVDPSERPLRLRILRVQVPLRTAHRSAHGAETMRDSILVEWTRSDGATGWGECPTLVGDGYVTGSTGRAWQVLVGELGPAVVGGGSALVSGAMAAVGALADARLDAALCAHGVSLSDHLGAVRRTVPRCAVLADVGAEPADLAERAAAAVRTGAAMVKVKVAPGHDVAVLDAVAAAVPGVPVAADANGSYEDPAAMSALDAWGPVFVEQPFPPTATWSQLAQWRRELSTQVALDESLVSPDAVAAALDAGALDVVSVKPARLGGLTAAATAVALARDAGCDAFVGGMFELGIGRAGAAALAALDGCTLPTDLGPSDAYVEQDVCERIVTDERGELVVPSGPGSGRRPDPDRVAEVTVDEVVLGA
jgi:O-succinylbenzoate synthase